MKVKTVWLFGEKVGGYHHDMKENFLNRTRKGKRMVKCPYLK